MPAPVTLSALTLDAYSNQFDYGGGNNLIYTGYAKSFQPTTTFTYGTLTTANPCQITITGHGLTTGQSVVITGGSGNWAGLNGTWIATVVDANNITVPVNSSAYTGSFAGTIQTNAPLTTQPIWAIQKNMYNGSNQLVASAWAGGSPGTVNIWNNRTATGATAIAYY